MSFSLTPEDLPPAQATEQDHDLAQQLRKSISRQFYEACDGVTQALLLTCKWQIVNEATALTLVIHSPDKRTNWRLLRHLVTIAQGLERFTDQAQIRICSPDGQCSLEVRVDEAEVYRDTAIGSGD